MQRSARPPGASARVVVAAPVKKNRQPTGWRPSRLHTQSAPQSLCRIRRRVLALFLVLHTVAIFQITKDSIAVRLSLSRARSRNTLLTSSPSNAIRVLYFDCPAAGAAALTTDRHRHPPPYRQRSRAVRYRARFPRTTTTTSTSVNYARARRKVTSPRFGRTQAHTHPSPRRSTTVHTHTHAQTPGRQPRQTHDDTQVLLTCIPIPPRKCLPAAATANTKTHTHTNARAPKKKQCPVPNRPERPERLYLTNWIRAFTVFFLVGVILCC